MSKYKVGDEVLIKAKVVEIDVEDTSVPYEVEVKTDSFWVEVDEIIDMESSCDDVKKAYDQGLNDAWELARYINETSKHVLREIFDIEIDVVHTSDAIFTAFTPQEALAKLKEYEEAQIEVGDVVIYGDSEVLVTHIHKQDFDGVQLSDDNEQGDFGDVYTRRSLKMCKKTGKHIDLSQIFEQIGE